jgi:hypothetical protein
MSKKNKEPVVTIDWKRLLPILIGLLIGGTGLIWWLLK